MSKNKLRYYKDDLIDKVNTTCRSVGCPGCTHKALWKPVLRLMVEAMYIVR